MQLLTILVRIGPDLLLDGEPGGAELGAEGVAGDAQDLAGADLIAPDVAEDLGQDGPIDPGDHLRVEVGLPGADQLADEPDDVEGLLVRGGVRGDGRPGAQLGGQAVGGEELARSRGPGRT